MLDYLFCSQYMYFTSLYIILYSLKNIYKSRLYAIYELCGRNKTRYMQDAGLLVALFRSSTKIACGVRSNISYWLLLLSNNRRYTHKDCWDRTYSQLCIQGNARYKQVWGWLFTSFSSRVKRTCRVRGHYISDSALT